MEQDRAAELRRWAGQLTNADDAEKRAAGRAILLLLDELATSPDPPAEGDAAPAEDAAVTVAPPPADVRRRARDQERRRRRNGGLLRLGVVLAVVGGLVYGGIAVGAIVAAPTLHAAGPVPNAVVGPATLPRLAFSVGGDHGTLEKATWKLDGVDVSEQARLRGDRLVFDGSKLGDGEHRLSVSAAGGWPGSSTTRSWRFAIDTTGPTIALDPPGGSIVSGRPLRVSGMLEPGAVLTADGRPVLVRPDGRFTVAWSERPTRPVLLAATDSLRNTTTKLLAVKLVPRLPPEPVRAVHVTFYAWTDPTLRQGVLDLIDQGRINTVELDVKDESGTVGFDAAVPFGRKIGAVRDIVDLHAAVRELHARGVRVVGRLVCFRDPIHAKAAWDRGWRDQVVQTPDGGQYTAGGYGGFTNFANPEVRRYEIAVAVAAAKAGVDDVLYDYVRRPDGPRDTMVFPGLKGSAERSIADFLAASRRALAPYKVFLGASVFGIAATRPTEIAQNIPMMAEHLDYVAPMVYPSHWGPGEYDVANPNAQPYDIVRASLADFQRKVEGTGARVVPWLQDFSLGVTYGAAQVAAQIRAARDDGIGEYLLWDPAVTYNAAALTANARKAVFPRKPAPDGGSGGRGAPAPNELGVVPVLMHHQLLPEATGPYDLTPDEFRAELERLYRDGFYPVTASDYVHGTLDVPAGKSPVVLTFDDATNNQVAFRRNGSLDPNSAVGILDAFSKGHPNFPAVATFYVPKNAFLGNGRTPRQTLRWLVAHGYELGNHTYDHRALNTLDPNQVQKELVLGQRLLLSRVPDAKVRTMALPLGAVPTPPTLAVSGTWRGQSYRFDGVFLAGAEPAPSPFSKRFDPTEIPRIRTTHWGEWHGQRDFTAGMWLDVLEKQPSLRYVSDGDPSTVAFPASAAAELAATYERRAKRL
jgi:peptidoglycan/xylan/chitin deacetylase (PgdA/CDA1 family)